jgi:Mn-dependent DtxR family transcriptional regulator
MLAAELGHAKTRPPMTARKRKPVRTSAPAPSDSTEDHLERIAELVDQKGYARVTDVAESLGLTTSTVSNMVRRLAARGFLNYEKYRGFSLTAQGRSVASRIKERHDLLSELLGLIGLPPEMVEREVEDIEHHLRPQTLEILGRLVNYWKTHPDALKSFLSFQKQDPC